MVKSIIGQNKKPKKEVNGLFDHVLSSVQKKIADKVSPITHRAQDSWYQAQKGFVKTINKTLNIDLKTSYTENLSQKLKHSHERKVERVMQKEIGDQLKKNRDLYYLRLKHYEELLEKYEGDKEAEKLIKEAKQKELDSIDNKYRDMVDPYQKQLNKKIRDDKYLQDELGDTTPDLSISAAQATGGKHSLEALHSPKKMNELYEALAYREIVPVEVTNHPQPTPMLPPPPQVGTISQSYTSNKDDIIDAEVLETKVKEALRTTPITIEKSQQELEEEFRLEKQQHEQEQQAQVLESEFRENHLTLQEQQVYYLKKISDKEFGGGEGKEGGGLVDTITNVLGTALDFASLKGGGGKGGLVKNIGNFAKNMMGGGGKAGGVLGKAGGVLGKAGGVLGKLAVPLAIATSAYGAFDGATDTEGIAAQQGINPEDVTWKDRTKHGVAGALDSLTLGLIGRDNMVNAGESLVNFITGKGWNSDKELREKGEEVGPGLIDAIVDGNPLKMMYDVFTGNTEDNLVMNAAGNAVNSVMGFLGFDTKKKEPPKEALEADVVTEAGYGRGGENLFKDEKFSAFFDRVMSKEAPLEAGAGDNPLPTNHLAELDKMYGVAPKDDSKAELPLADATKDSPSAQTSSATIVTNNNSTVVQQQGPRYRISDQSTLMLSVQGA